MELAHAYIAVIVVLIILLLYCNTYSLEGVWIADVSFCEEAECGNIILYIGECTGFFTKSYRVYLLIEDASHAQLLENTATMMHISRSLWGDASIKFDATPWSAAGDLRIRVDREKNLISIYNAQTVYAELYRDNILSDAAASN